MKKGFTALKKGTWEEYKEHNGPSTGLKRRSQDEFKKGERCVRDHAQKHGQFAANHCALHNVVLVPAQQQFLFGRQRLVGLWEKIHKVVVRNLWRKVRLEATEQAFGRTKRWQYWANQGLKACAQIWLMRWNCWRTSKKMEMASYRILWRTCARRAAKVLRAASVNALRLTMILMLDPWVGTREHFKFGSRKAPEGCLEVPGWVDMESWRSEYVEGVDKCQPHWARKMGPSRGWCGLKCLQPGVVQWHRRRRLGRNLRFLQGNEWCCGCKEAAGGPEGKSLVGHECSQRQEGSVLWSSSRRGHFEKK